jgi:hypothetical protein
MGPFGNYFEWCSGYRSNNNNRDIPIRKRTQQLVRMDL